jgi:hypothetical protein
VNIGGDMRFGSWRQFTAEALIVATTFAIAFAAIDATAELILGAVALVGLALMVEPDVLAQPARDIAPQPTRSPVQPESARPEPWVRVHFDAGVVDATSV